MLDQPPQDVLTPALIQTVQDAMVRLTIATPALLDLSESLTGCLEILYVSVHSELLILEDLVILTLEIASLRMIALLNVTSALMVV
jgi:hypothetical protein